MSTEPEYKRAAYDATRIIERIIRDQAPVKTGALKSSVRIQPRFKGDDISLEFYYLEYGKYLDLGTGPYRTPPARRRNWNPKPGKGKGGNKPRLWTTLKKDVRREVNRLFAKYSFRFFVRRMSTVANVKQ